MSAAARLAPSSAERFDRFRQIEWWDQEKLAAARVLVIGAGALGNEILKNLALLGVGNAFVADLDTIESSNLSRSILYRERDAGSPKSAVAARALREIYPAMRVAHFQGDVVFDLGLGVYRWADLVIGGLDNREARLQVNRSCYKLHRPWIDGATEALQGVVRVFSPPEGPCYECTLTAGDWTVLRERRGCAGLRIEGLPPGRVPTTPVTASIIAALETQEALKVLHGLPGLAGKGLVFNGMINDAYVFDCHRNDECESHDVFAEVIPLPISVRSATPRQLLAEAQTRLGDGAVLELTHELLVAFECARCSESESVLRPLANVAESRATCPGCDQSRRPVTTRALMGNEDFLDRPWSELGLPLFDIVGARRGLAWIGFEFAADRAAVLGPLQG